MSISRAEITFCKVSEYHCVCKSKKTCSACKYSLKYGKEYYHHSDLEPIHSKKMIFPMLVDELHFKVSPNCTCKFFKPKK